VGCFVVGALAAYGGSSVVGSSAGDGGAMDASTAGDASLAGDAAADRGLATDARTRDVVADNDPRCPSFADADPPYAASAPTTKHSGNRSVGLSCMYPEGRCVCRG
jgi:hypothetical protein